MKRIITIMSFVFAVILTVCVFTSETYEKYEIVEDVKAEYGECEEHIYPNGGAYETIEPSCSRKGLKYRTCAVCAFTERVELPKDPDAHPEVDFSQAPITYEKIPTCTEGGIGYYVCTFCNKAAKKVELEINPDGHVKDGDFVVIEKETCKSAGTMAHVCKYCNEYFNYQTIASDPLAHVMTDDSEWVVTQMPTCAEDGTVEGYCDVCKGVAVTKTIPATGNHTTDDEWFIVTDETCASDGVKAHKCSVCMQPVDETPIPADPEKHIYSTDYTVDVEATCIFEGSASRHCIYCDSKTDVKVIPVDETAHLYNNDWVVTSEPTCTELGYRHRFCQLCGEQSISTAIPTVEHKYPEEYEIIQESADGVSFQVKYICTVCSEEYITIITTGTNPGDGDIGANIDPITKKYIITPVKNTVIRVDYEKMFISNVARNVTVKDFLRNFTNSNVFVIYNEAGGFVNEEENIGTGHRLNYETPDGNVTNYYVSVTGDLDSNGKITAADARRILRVAAKLDTISEVYSVAADVNLDGSITPADARKTLRVSANMEYFEETYVY